MASVLDIAVAHVLRSRFVPRLSPATCSCILVHCPLTSDVLARAPAHAADEGAARQTGGAGPPESVFATKMKPLTHVMLTARQRTAIVMEVPRFYY